jgi:hypothetical protein
MTPDFNPISYQVWLKNHAMTMKVNPVKYYIPERSSYLHTFLIVCSKSKKIPVKFEKLLLFVLYLLVFLVNKNVWQTLYDLFILHVYLCLKPTSVPGIPSGTSISPSPSCFRNKLKYPLEEKPSHIKQQFVNNVSIRVNSPP